MNDIVKFITDRRSVKSFSPKKVSDSDLKVIVENGMWAPNGRNLQLRFFSVVSSEKAMGEIVEAIREVKGDKSAEPFYGAPCAIYVSADRASSFSGLDAGAAMQNMILTAKALGIDSCFMAGPLSLFDHKDAARFKAELAIPENYAPMCALALGYRNDGVDPTSQRDLSKVKYL